MDDTAITKLRNSGYTVDFDPGNGTVTVSRIRRDMVGHAMRIDSADATWFGIVDADGIALLTREDHRSPGR